MAKERLLLAFYGDDFTGSTDALEFMTRAGAKTMLFLEVPSEDELKKFKDLDAIGIAGKTRSMKPEEMREELKTAFQKIALLNPRHVHYKVCSTFDSSPEIGNIGVAIDQGLKQFKNKFAPILVAAPHLGRYMAFGNLFAQMGIGSKGETFRLDRHPSMMHHPVTPVKEADLRKHLSLQCYYNSGLIDLLDIEKSSEEIQDKLKKLIADNSVIFFDGIYEDQLIKIGKVIDDSVENDKPLFSIGSSGIGKALGDHWQQKGLLNEVLKWKKIKESKPILVLSGSVSPVTASQIEYALENGFKEVAIDPNSLKSETSDTVRYTEKVLSFLQKGNSVILHTSKGPEDARLAETKSITEGFGWESLKSRRALPERFGKLLGKTANEVLNHINLKRMVIAGGDTSSYVARELGITAVEMIAPLVKGAPLCKAYASGFPVDGMEINLKGGQVGDKTYFVALQKGKIEKI